MIIKNLELMAMSKSPIKSGLSKGKYFIKCKVTEKTTSIKEIEDFIKIYDDDGFPSISNSNSAYPFNCYNLSNELLDIPTNALTQGHIVDLAIDIKYSDEYDTNYFVVKGVRFHNSEFDIYNPFNE